MAQACRPPRGGSSRRLSPSSPRPSPSSPRPSPSSPRPSPSSRRPSRSSAGHGCRRRRGRTPRSRRCRPVGRRRLWPWPFALSFDRLTRYSPLPAPLLGNTTVKAVLLVAQAHLVLPLTQGRASAAMWTPPPTGGQGEVAIVALCAVSFNRLTKYSPPFPPYNSGDAAAATATKGGHRDIKKDGKGANQKGGASPGAARSRSPT